MPIRFGFGLPGPFYYTSGERKKGPRGSGFASLLFVLVLGLGLVTLWKFFLIGLLILAGPCVFVGSVLWLAHRSVRREEMRRASHIHEE